jgi:putative nucleotidyltransferase with HDIG domain
MKTREEALELLHEWVKSESLRRHCLGVAACMEAYARKYEMPDGEIDDYWICGLLHDFDYEKICDEIKEMNLEDTEKEMEMILKRHPSEGCKVLKEKGYGDEITEAIMGHGNHTGVPRISKMAKTLFAVDELSGLCIAYARVRPAIFQGMKAKSLNKAVKKKDFAAAVSRDDIGQGIEELGVDMKEHFNLVISALRGISGELGF